MAAADSGGLEPATGIRPATTSDLDRLIDILWSVAAEGRWIGTQVPFDRHRRREILESALADESWTILVAEVAEAAPLRDGPVKAGAHGRSDGPVKAGAHGRSDGPVGAGADEGTDGPAVVVGEVALRLAPYGVADLSMLLLDGWRGRGIGTALLDAGVEWARGAGAHKVALEVWPHNEPALHLYRRAGFVEEGRKRRHYRRANGELWDAILMGLPLT